MDYAFVKSVIRSRVKGVYKEVNAIFDGTADNALRQRYAAVAQELPLMRELYHKLAKLRAAGARWILRAARQSWCWTRRAAVWTW